MTPKYKFAIAICPLCNKDIVILGGTYGPNHTMWQCPELVIPVNGGRPLPHYQVEWDKDTGIIAQHVIAGQFFLDTFNTDYQTRIHAALPLTYTHGNYNAAKHVMTVPQLRIDSSDKLLERVKLLVIFS
jgi:hypothetical protein